MFKMVYYKHRKTKGDYEMKSVYAQSELIDLTTTIAQNSITLSGWVMIANQISGMGKQLEEINEKLSEVQSAAGLTAEEVYAIFNEPINILLSVAKELKGKMPKLK